MIMSLIFSVRGHAAGPLSGVRSWLCYYGAAFPDGNIPPYDLYVFQSEAHPDLASLKKSGGRAVGYISVGEVHESSPGFAPMQAAGVVLEGNPDWQGAHRVDLRSDRWQDFVLTRIIPAVLSQGFDGIFIDTIDVAWYLEHEKGMTGAIQKAASLVKEIRKRYPDKLIVLNNGLFLLDDVGEAVDALVVEDIFTLYDFQKKRYELANKRWTEERLVPAKAFQEKFGKPVLSLDYVKRSDRKAIKRVAGRARDLGFVPYIAEINLDSIFFHP